MIALVRYQLALLLRSQRWLPPLLLYAAIAAVGLQQGQPLLDSLGFAAAALLPVSAWLVRVCVTGEPEAARACVAAAAGPARTHLASLLAGLLAATVLGAAGVLVVTVLSDPHTNDGRTAVPLVPAAGAGLLAALTCVLFGTAVGALCNRPFLRSPGWAVPSSLLAVLLVLVAGASPANAAVRGLVSASRDGAVPVPWLPLAAALPVAAAAAWAACRLVPRRR